MNGKLTRKTGRMGRGFHGLEVLFAVLALVLAGVAWWGFARFYQGDIAPEQPIPFSHRIHVQEKKLGCLFCHQSAGWSDRAGIPPLETCMLCHERIAIHYAPIADLRRHYRENRPVPWVRVAWVNEFVYFPHAMHLQAGVDCGSCHGDVRMMDRVATVHPFRMGFCIGCHRETGATLDCFNCHR